MAYTLLKEILDGKTIWGYYIQGVDSNGVKKGPEIYVRKVKALELAKYGQLINAKFNESSKSLQGLCTDLRTLPTVQLRDIQGTPRKLMEVEETMENNFNNIEKFEKGTLKVKLFVFPIEQIAIARKVKSEYYNGGEINSRRGNLDGISKAEKEINDFCNKHNVIDIQCFSAMAGNNPPTTSIVYSLIYKN